MDDTPNKTLTELADEESQTPANKGSTIYDGRRSRRQDDENFGLSELKFGKHIVRTLKAVDLEIVDRDDFVGTLSAVDKFLENAESSLK